jgi:hypothetical protein
LPPSRRSGLYNGRLTRCIAGRRPIKWVEGFKELNEGRGL